MFSLVVETSGVEVHNDRLHDPLRGVPGLVGDIGLKRA